MVKVKRFALATVVAFGLSVGVASAADACYDGYQSDIVIANFFYGQCMNTALGYFGMRNCQQERTDAINAARDLFYECRGYRD